MCIKSKRARCVVCLNNELQNERVLLSEQARLPRTREASSACNEMTFGREIRFAIEMMPLAS